MWGEFLAQSGRIADALPVFSKAAERCKMLLEADPKNTSFRRTSAIAYYRLSQWEEHEVAASEWGNKALEIRQELSENEPEDSKLKLELLPSLARSGDLGTATALAEEFSLSEKVDSELLIEVAKAYSLCGGRTTAAKERGRLLSLSEDALRKAVDLGTSRSGIFRKRCRSQSTLRDTRFREAARNAGQPALILFLTRALFYAFCPVQCRIGNLLTANLCENHLFIDLKDGDSDANRFNSNATKASSFPMQDKFEKQQKSRL